ncbi:MAG: hypothetical protein V3V13_12955 [Paracoccaceae bacterium]
MNPKKYIITLSLIAAFMLGSYWYYNKDRRDIDALMHADGWTWSLEDVAWKPLWDSYQVSATLRPVRGPGQFTVTTKSLSILCGGILTSFPLAPHDGITRKDIFLVTITLPAEGYRNRNDGAQPESDLVYQISVKDGACNFADNTWQVVFRYPHPLEDWDLQDFKYKIRGENIELTVNFEWRADGEPEFDTFPFEKACEAVMSAPPIGLRKYLLRDEKLTLKVFAKRIYGISIANVSYSKGRFFNIVAGVCLGSGKAVEL